MWYVAAVGVDDYLPAGKAAVAVGAAYDKAACGVHKYLCFGYKILLGYDLQYYLFRYILAELLHGDIRIVLSRDDYRVYGYRSAVLIIYRDLALAVRPEIAQLAALACFCKAHGKLMGKGYRQGHKLLSFVTGEAEHHALIPRAGGKQPVVIPILGLEGLVHSHGYIGRLCVQLYYELKLVAVKAVFRLVVAYTVYCAAYYVLNVHAAF